MKYNAYKVQQQSIDVSRKLSYILAKFANTTNVFIHWTNIRQIFAQYSFLIITQTTIGSKGKSSSWPSQMFLLAARINHLHQLHQLHENTKLSLSFNLSLLLHCQFGSFCQTLRNILKRKAKKNLSKGVTNITLLSSSFLPLNFTKKHSASQLLKCIKFQGLSIWVKTPQRRKQLTLIFIRCQTLVWDSALV